MEYETVIGLEVHAQLLTKSKMFCSCAAEYQHAPPNTLVCEVCMGQPGVLPVINARAVEFVIATGLALGCTIARHTKFDRKNYPYPDLMKGYQISQYDQPIASGGRLVIEADRGETEIRVTRVHLEEDVAKLLHRGDGNDGSYSLLDINRAGVPLMETVSEPDMRTPEEARSYLTQLRSILRYIGVSTANMEEGSFRCDANISVRPKGSAELGPKVEVKNMNSFRSVYNALKFEQKRQTRMAAEGERIAQETRGWDEDRGVTSSQRSKEGESDYRYFPDPDLPPLSIDPAWVEEVRRALPELPTVRKERFVADYALPLYDAGLLTGSKGMADYFESVLDAVPLDGEALQSRAKNVSNWLLGEMSKLLNETGAEIDGVKIEPASLVELLDLVDDGTLSIGMARTVLATMFETGGSPKAIAARAGLEQVTDSDTLLPVVDEAISANPDPVADYLGGKETAMRFLVGQVMKITRGSADPKLAQKLVKEKLEAMR